VHSTNHLPREGSDVMIDDEMIESRRHGFRTDSGTGRTLPHIRFHGLYERHHLQDEAERVWSAPFSPPPPSPVQPELTAAFGGAWREATRHRRHVVEMALGGR
jgi:hypothetical protein